jgi:hypothetical protein
LFNTEPHQAVVVVVVVVIKPLAVQAYKVLTAAMGQVHQQVTLVAVAAVVARWA